MQPFVGLKTLQSFAPNWGDPELLEETLVGRRALVDRLLQLAVDGANGQTLHQQLLVGARGSGKTHVIRVLQNRLRAMEALREKLLIIYLLEDELGVATFLDFLMRLLDAIQRWSPDAGDLASAIEEIRDLPPRLQENRAKSALLEQLGDRRALILMENLGVMFDEKAGFGLSGQQALRDLVQQHRRFMIFATSQALVEGARDRDAPFYRFFEVTNLRPLDREEAMTFLVAVADAYGKPEMVEFLRSPDGRGRMSAIFEFTGGNHRLLVTFYDCLEAKSVVRLSESFMGRLNPLRAYYQEQMRSLSAQQQKIVQFLALQRPPCNVKQIARGCLASQNTVSRQLKELVDRNVVSRNPRGRESYYELTEALFRIVYQADLEQEGAPVRLFVDFLGNFYSAKELLRRQRGYALLAQRFGNHESTPFLDETAFYSRAIAAYHPEVLEAIPAGPGTEGVATGDLPGFFDELRRDSAYRDIVHFAEFLAGEPDVAVLHTQAYAYSRLGQTQPAEETARRALEEAPDDVEALLVLAEVLVQDREAREEALRHAHRALSLDGENPDTLERAAVVVGNAGEHAEALEHFEALTRLRADHAPCWWRKGLALANLERPHEAGAAHRQALTLDPDHAQAHEQLGILRLNAQAHTEALEHFQTLTRLRADYANGWWLEGRTLENLERWDEAETAYRQALTVDPDNADAHGRLGILRGIAGASAEALEHFEALTRLRADYANGWRLKGRALKSLQRPDEAETAYRQALTLDPDNAAAHHQLGFLRGNAGAHAEALEHFKAVTRLLADYADGWRLKGRALENLERPDEAETAYRQALALDPGNVLALARLASLYESRGETEESAKAFEAAIRLSVGPDRARVLNTRGETRRLREDFQGALFDYQTALDADPEAVLPRFNTVTVRLALGDLQGALDEFPRAVAAALAPGRADEGTVVQSFQENWEALFVYGHRPHWSPFFEASLQLVKDRGVLRYAEQALPLVVFTLLRRCETIETSRLEQVVEHLGRDVAPFMDASVAKRFLEVGIAHFKNHDPKALLRLPREERRVFARELGLTQEVHGS